MFTGRTIAPDNISPTFSLRASAERPKPTAHPKPASAVKGQRREAPRTERAIGDDPVYVNVDTGKRQSSTSLSPSTPALSDTETWDPEGLDNVMLHNDVYYDDDIYMTSEAAKLRLDGVQQHLVDRLRAEGLAAEFAVSDVGRFVITSVIYWAMYEHDVFCVNVYVYMFSLLKPFTIQV